MRLKLISCEVLYREMCAAVARSPHQVDIELLPKGLHDLGCPAMSARLQEAADGVDGTRYEAVLLGYALCGNGLHGLRASRLPLVASLPSPTASSKPPGNWAPTVRPPASCATGQPARRCP